MATPDLQRTAAVRQRTAYNPQLHGFAVVVMIATYLLLLAGGNVTSKGAGMAVPDWPLSFKSVNPEGWTTNMGGERPGVRDEHGHRLMGGTVGVLVTGLGLWLAASEPRKWVRVLGLAAWIAVVAQAVLGGFRVLHNSVQLAIVHGCLAQAFFCVTVALVAVTSEWWVTGDRRRMSSRGGPGPASLQNEKAMVWSAVAALGAVYVQLILGAVMRHTQSTWIPHAGWALVVGLSLLTVTRFVYSHAEARRVLSMSAITLLVLYSVQVFLGLTTLMVIYPLWSAGQQHPQTLAQDWLPTVHMACGAAILGLTAWVAVYSVGMRHAAEAALPSEVAGVAA